MPTKNIKGYTEYLNEATYPADTPRTVRGQYPADTDPMIMEIKGTPEYAFAMEGRRIASLLPADQLIELLPTVLEEEIVPTLRGLYKEYGRNPIGSTLFFGHVFTGDGRYHEMQMGGEDILLKAGETNSDLKYFLAELKEGARIVNYLESRKAKMKEYWDSKRFG